MKAKERREKKENNRTIEIIIINRIKEIRNIYINEIGKEKKKENKRKRRKHTATARCRRIKEKKKKKKKRKHTYLTSAVKKNQS